MKVLVAEQIAASGIATTNTIDSPTSWRTAITTPTTIVIGAATAIVHAITTSICTCCTSLVTRVMSDGEPNWPTSRADNRVTLWNIPWRTSRPNFIANLAEKYMAATASITCTTVIPSRIAPKRSM